MKKPFCDYCTCSDCVNGTPYIAHAFTTDGKWICNICYCYDVCIDANIKKGIHNGPCDDMNCEHRPTLATGWTKLEGK